MYSAIHFTPLYAVVGIYILVGFYHLFRHEYTKDLVNSIKCLFGVVLLQGGVAVMDSIARSLGY